MGCTHHCSDCTSNCSGNGKNEKESFVEEANKLSHIKNEIGDISGKGVVAKTFVTTLMP